MQYLRQETAAAGNAAGGLSRHIWDELNEIAMETCDERILMLTGLGATESGPFALCANKETTAGLYAVPTPAQGIET